MTTLISILENQMYQTESESNSSGLWVYYLRWAFLTAYSCTNNQILKEIGVFCLNLADFVDRANRELTTQQVSIWASVLLKVLTETEEDWKGGIWEIGRFYWVRKHSTTILQVAIVNLVSSTCRHKERVLSVVGRVIIGTLN